MTADNASQQQRLTSLLDLHNSVQAIDDQLIALRRQVNGGQQPLDALTHFFQEGRDKAFMDRYRAVATGFNNAESSLLATRSDDVNNLAFATKMTLSLAGLTTILLSLVLGTIITRSIVRALGGEPKAAADIAGMIARVT